MDISSDIYLVKWRDGTFSFLFGQNQQTLLHALDRLGDPSDAEVRVAPPELMAEFTLDQNDEPNVFEIDAEVEPMIWQQCPKQVWPLEALGS